MTTTPRVMMLVLNLDIGGQEQMIMELCNELRQQNIDSLICCLDKPGALAHEAEDAGIQVVALNKGSGMQLSAVRHLRGLIQERSVNIVHSHNGAGLVYGALGTVGTKVPHVHTRHGVGEVGRRARWRNRLCSLTLTHLIAVSESLKQNSLEQDQIPGAKVSVIANGVNLDRFLSLDLPSFPGGAPVIGHIARLSDVKNQALLLRVFAQFLVTTPAARLVIVGDGPNSSQLQAQAAELGITDSVAFTGARRDIPTLLASFHWFALTSISEGTPMSVIEAMAAGRPVVSTNVGGLSEIVQQGETGYLVDLDQADSMLERWSSLAQEDGLLQRMGIAARQSVQAGYGSDAMATAYADIYRDSYLKSR